MPRLPRPHNTACLSASLHERLNVYALAASATGVSLLAMVQPAEGKIIYTPAHKNAVGVRLDLNHDGSEDFRFCIRSLYSSCPNPLQPQGNYFLLLVRPHKPKNEIWGSGRAASALLPGVSIGKEGMFQEGHSIMAGCAQTTGGHTCGGPWLDVTKRYLGLKFVIKGKIHYGWARLNVHWLEGQAILTGYAYESIPNKPITTGETKGPDLITVQAASLGHLAAGVSAIPAWRINRTAATTH